MSEETTLIFDPRRERVVSIIEAVLRVQDEDSVEQGVVDVVMAACILGELSRIESIEELIHAAMPDAKKAADHLAKHSSNLGRGH